MTANVLEPDVKTSSTVTLRPRRSGGRNVAIAIGGLAIGGVAMLAWPLIASPTRPALPAPPLATPARTSVVALGWLIPASEVIRIAGPGDGQSSRLAALRVQEGQGIAAGDIIAVLDTAAKLQAQVVSAEAQVALKRLALARMSLDIANTRAARRSALDRARADLEQFQAEFDRQQALVAKDIATASTFEKRRRDLANAKASVEEAARALERIDSVASDLIAPRIEGASGGDPDATTAQIDIAVARQDLDMSMADLALARVNLDQAYVRAPISGQVLAVFTRTGEKIGTDGIIEMGATDQMRAVVEVYQADIGLVRVGQRVEIKADAVGDRLTGTVERVGLRVKRQTIINNDPATDTDARVVEVRVALDAASAALVAGLTRLQIRAFIKL